MIRWSGDWESFDLDLELGHDWLLEFGFNVHHWDLGLGGYVYRHLACVSLKVLPFELALMFRP